ncbi:hypothetical protein HK096_004699 [Nowakowskiella sp. JEL0078]|nr:hypothetical protein HK096_004699 [Nowakowskiella sp. JEL0078]
MFSSDLLEKSMDDLQEIQDSDEIDAKQRNRLSIDVETLVSDTQPGDYVSIEIEWCDDEMQPEVSFSDESIVNASVSTSPLGFEVPEIELSLMDLNAQIQPQVTEILAMGLGGFDTRLLYTIVEERELDEIEFNTKSTVSCKTELQIQEPDVISDTTSYISDIVVESPKTFNVPSDEISMKESSLMNSVRNLVEDDETYLKLGDVVEHTQTLAVHDFVETNLPKREKMLSVDSIETLVGQELKSIVESDDQDLLSDKIFRPSKQSLDILGITREEVLARKLEVLDLVFDSEILANSEKEEKITGTLDISPAIREITKSIDPILKDQEQLNNHLDLAFESEKSVKLISTCDKFSESIEKKTTKIVQKIDHSSQPTIIISLDAFASVTKYAVLGVFMIQVIVFLIEIMEITVRRFAEGIHLAADGVEGTVANIVAVLVMGMVVSGGLISQVRQVKKGSRGI